MFCYSFSLHEVLQSWLVYDFNQKLVNTPKSACVHVVLGFSKDACCALKQITAQTWKGPCCCDKLPLSYIIEVQGAGSPDVLYFCVHQNIPRKGNNFRYPQELMFG